MSDSSPPAEAPAAAPAAPESAPAAAAPAPEPAPTVSKSNLDLVNECDSFPYYTSAPDAYLIHINTYYALQVAGHDYPVGFVLPSVAAVLRGLDGWALDDESRTLTLTGGGSDARGRTALLARTTAAMRATGHFRVLDKWRDELYAVYGRDRTHLFDLERAAAPLFGVVSYGVHANAFVRDDGPSGGGGLRLWIPRRARTKQTYAGMLDNAVAGGIAAGETPLDCLVRECAEEASLPADLVRRCVRPAGAVTYFYVRDARAGGETHLLQPEVQYVYDLELPAEVTLAPNDDEVDRFYLWSVEKVREALRRGEFKPNCALVMLDFFVRHGVLTPENEPDYVEICARLHRRLEFPTL